MNQNVGQLRYWRMCDDLIDGGGHLLVAGQTGSGKSVVINDYLYSLTAKRTPANAKFVLIDPKKVELDVWKYTPFCWIYADDQRSIVAALDSVINEMGKRYSVMKNARQKVYSGSEIWVIVDELGDMMTMYKRDFLPRLQRIAQLGRAAKINLICGSQSPARKVIPAELTLNFTHKLALKCDTKIESRQVVGIAGAEELPRHGVGIMKTPAGIEQISIPMTCEEAIAERVRTWASPVKRQRENQFQWYSIPTRR